jgi:hypothetical protein
MHRWAFGGHPYAETHTRFLSHFRGGEQLADLEEHQRERGAASLLLLPVPGHQPQTQQPAPQQQQPAAGAAEPGSINGPGEAAQPPFLAAGVFGLGLGPDVPARRM